MTGVTKLGRYVKRAAQEPGVQDKGRIAMDSTRSALRRISKRKSSPRALLNDKKLQRDLARAVEALRDASMALTAPSTKRSRGRVGLGAAIVGLLAAATAVFIWRDKLRSMFSSETSETGDGARAQSSGETSVTAAPPVAPPVAPPGSAEADPVPTDDA
jgi:ferric-dicitrate binding protein FerR (iron transport regulator)